VGEALFGIAVVALFVGLLLGRSTERARRTWKDWGTAKTTTTKARSIAFGELRKAAGTIIIVGALIVAVFIGAMNWPG
jgi:hypothetical protein